MVLKTEDTGKMFEMAICYAYGIEYNGKYKYSMELDTSGNYSLYIYLIGIVFKTALTRSNVMKFYVFHT